MILTTEVDAPITHVTVFRDRAQVRRTATVKLDAGEHRLAFSGAWAQVDRESLQVSTGKGSEHVVLRAVHFNVLVSKDDIRPLKQQLMEELEGLRAEEEKLDDAKSVLAARSGALEAIALKVTTKTTTHNAAMRNSQKWMEFAAFIRKERDAMAAQRRELATQAREVTRKVADTKAQLAKLGGSVRVTTKDVAEVLLQVRTATTLVVQLSYVVNDARWTPIYDLRADSKKRTMDVTYHAMVRQSTGEAWERVAVKLSTARPCTGGTAPELSPWTCGIEHYQPPMRRAELCTDGGPVRSGAPMMMQQMMTNTFAGAEVEMAMAAAPGGGGGGPPQPPQRRAAATAAAVAEASATTATFAVPGTHTIGAGNEPVKLTIMHDVFDAHLRYSAVPKLDGHVYLKAKATNMSDFHFLRGAVNVYADNQFISTSEMDEVAPTEEFWTFLGVDDSVRVKRSLIHKKRSSVGGMLSGKRKRVEFKYAFTLNNTKSTEEELVVWDQLPICENKSITCSLIEPPEDEPAAAGRLLHKINDLQAIEWFAPLKPKQQLRFSFVFAVEYPAEEHISGL